MSKKPVDWEKKYKEAVLEIDILEKTQNNDQLRLVVSYLTLGLQGQSSDLDHELSLLHGALSGSASVSLPRKVVINVEKHIRQLDQSREEVNQAIIRIMFEWIDQLKSSVLATSSEFSALFELQYVVTESVESIHKFPALVQDLTSIQAKIFAAQKAELDKTRSIPSVSVDLSLLGSELLNLINALNLSRANQAEANDLISRIEKGFNLEDLSDILANVVMLAQLASARSNADFENYLITLNTQLIEVQGFLNENRSEQVVSGNAHKQLDEQVRYDVTNINQAVKDSHDLGELKVAVASQLAGIVRAMDEFKRGEEERDSYLHERYSALMLHVAEMEEETGRVKAHIEEERLKARTDSLTGLPNRVAYDDHLNKEFGLWTRYRQGFSVAVGDLDFFKRINDTYGHLAGDKVLRLVAQVLNKNLRASDFVARFGGEEFVILMPSTQVEEGAKAIEKLRKSISKSPFNFHGEPVTITISFGVAQTRESDTKDSLFGRADAALYKAKQDGRNRVCIG